MSAFRVVTENERTYEIECVKDCDTEQEARNVIEGQFSEACWIINLTTGEIL